jgi:RNA polymerase sigma-70 factor (ECF subfamily)
MYSSLYMSHRKLIAELFSARKDALHSFFSRRVRARQDAADLMQEAYLRILRAGHGTIDDPETYLLTVASNLVKEHAFLTHRRETREMLTDPNELPECPVEIEYADQNYLEARKARLSRVVKQLDARYQLVLSLTYEQGLSQTEIAAKLSISRSMVQKILNKAHAHCRARMIREGER